MMCEPYHSIVQYPNDPSSPRMYLGLGKLYQWGKQILDWLHLSRFGSGHHESIHWAKHENHLILPKATLWEGAWWNRTIQLDGSLNSGDKETATRYFNVTVAGSLHSLRQFLEVSMQQSSNPRIYQECVMEKLLNVDGRNILRRKLKNVGSTSSIIKCILGFTRKRELLVPEWADDVGLWKGSKLSSH